MGTNVNRLCMFCRSDQIAADHDTDLLFANRRFDGWDNLGRRDNHVIITRLSPSPCE